MQQHKGFSLLEILVAFSIMAIALTVLLRIFGNGVQNAVISEEYTIAVQIAESLMARTGVETPLQAGSTQGTEGDKYEWQIIVNPTTQSAARPSLKTENTAQQNTAPDLMSVLVRVAWGDTENARQVELQTLRTQAKGPS